MGRKLPVRTFRGGAYIPTVPYSGNQGDAAWLVENMIRRGKGGAEEGARHYWEVYGGQRDLNEEAPLVALTGTIAVTEDSTTVTGTGTLFLTELRIGQFVIIIDTTNMETQCLFVAEVISDTEYISAQPATRTLSGETGWRMCILFPLNQKRAILIRGNAHELDRGSILCAGQGELLVNGEPLQGTTLNATNQPQIAIRAPDGDYTPYTLGMDTPTGVTAAGTAGGTKMQAGNYSVIVYPARWQTVGYNNPSDRVDVTLAANEKVRITFPAMDTANGQTAWIVYGTTFQQSLGAQLDYLNGPWHFVAMITDEDVSSAGGTFDFEWYDSEIETQEIASFDNDAPPQAEFVVPFNDGVVWISCHGRSFERAGPVVFDDPSPGPVISPSKPNNIEAAPAGIRFATSPPETIIGAVPGDARIYLLTPNTLQIAQPTPSDAVPVLIRPFWMDGFSNPYQLILVDGNLYGFTNGGPVRSVGGGDSVSTEREWASYVSKVTEEWTPTHVLVAYHPGKDAVCFFHAADALNEQGFWTTRVLLYGLGQDSWIGNVRISQEDRDSIVSGVATVGDKLYFIMGGRRTS